MPFSEGGEAVVWSFGGENFGEGCFGRREGVVGIGIANPMLIRLTTGENGGAGRRANRLRIAAREEKAIVGEIFQGWHIGQLNAGARRVVELGGIDAPVIEDEKEDIARPGDAEIVGGGNRPIDDGGIVSGSESGRIEIDFQEPVERIVSDDGRCDAPDSHAGDLCREGR